MLAADDRSPVNAAGAAPSPSPRWFERIGPAGRAWCVLGGALVLSFLLYAPPILGHFGTTFVGQGNADAKLYVWDLAWWPHALSAGLNPFHPRLVWAPSGVNMAWVTGLPGPALAAWPITAAFGAVAASNVIAILSPALATWAAYLLSHELTDRFWPSVVGGLVFGFSTYETAQLRGHMNLYLVFPVPLAAYLVVRYAHGRMTRRWYVAALAAVLVAEFSISTEVFATMVLFAGIAVALVLVLAPAARPLLRAAAGPTALAGLIAAIVLAPYLWYAAVGLPAGPLRPIGGSSTDLLSYLFPRAGTWLGGSTFTHLTDRFPTNVSEDGAYLGPLLIGVLIAAFAAGHRDRVMRWLFAFIAVAAVLSMGAVLYAGAQRTVPMPWAIIAKLPVLRDALPDRFTMYVWLGVSVIVARWLAMPREPGHVARTVARWGAVGLGVLLLLPNVHQPGLHRPIAVPRFFSAGLYRQALAPHQTILILHDRRDRGAEMVLQEESGFAFSMPQGHTGREPWAFASDPLWQGVQQGRLGGTTPDRFRRWLVQHQVRAIVVMSGSMQIWTPFLDAVTGSHADRLGGILLYRPANGGGWAPVATAPSRPSGSRHHARGRSRRSGHRARPSRRAVGTG